MNSENDRTVVFDMLLLVSFGQIRKLIFSPDYLSKLGPVLEKILKPRPVELCPSL
jgi:hypothetical protein